MSKNTNFYISKFLTKRKRFLFFGMVINLKLVIECISKFNTFNQNYKFLNDNHKFVKFVITIIHTN